MDTEFHAIRRARGRCWPPRHHLGLKASRGDSHCARAGHFDRNRISAADCAPATLAENRLRARHLESRPSRYRCASIDKEARSSSRTRTRESTSDRGYPGMPELLIQVVPIDIFACGDHLAVGCNERDGEAIQNARIAFFVNGRDDRAWSSDVG